MEDSISEQVTRALMLQLSGDERRQLTKRHTENSEAYRLYLKGRYFWNKRTDLGLRKAIEYFQQAIDIDPRYALAYAGVADSYLLGASALAPSEALPKAKAAALRALEIDDTLAEAHTSLARVKMSFEWDWESAGRGFGRAIELGSNYATAHQWYANYLLATGQLSEAVKEIGRAQELDPVSLTINTAVGWVYYMAGRYDEAVEQYEKVLEMDPDFVQARREVSFVYAQKGMYREALAAIRKAASVSGDDPLTLGLLGRTLAAAGKGAQARRVIERLKQLSRQKYVLPHILATIYVALDEKEQALEWLEKAYEDRSSPLVWLKVDPWFDDLRSEPRFINLLRRVGLSP